MGTENKASKTVVITGASSGIGQACAELFAKHGYSIVLGARRFNKIISCAEFLSSRYDVDVTCSELDVRIESSVQNFLKESKNKHKKIDILINNAGLALGKDPIVSAKDSDWNTMIETNFLGLLRVTRAFLPGMIAENKGHVINIGSIAGFQSYAGGAVYAGTKHAVRAISQALREELYGTSVRVTEIDPGMVETEFSVVRFSGDNIKAKSIYSGMTPLTPTDIADTVFFATSRPEHVNVDSIVIQPTDQVSVGKVYRRE